MVKTILSHAVLMAVLLLLGASCAGAEHYPSVSGICGAWLDIKTSLGCYQNEIIHPGDPVRQIDDFLEMIYQFSRSPIGTMYEGHKPDEMKLLSALDSGVRRLKKAAQNGEGTALLPIVLEIDAYLEQLRQLDTELSDASQMNQYRLFLLFAIFIIIIIFVMYLMYDRVKKAEKRELQTLAFSRETIIAQEQERSRIAQELHDTVAQDLWRLSFETANIDKSPDADTRTRLCRELVKGQKEVMGRIRSICDSLIPPDFHRRGLADAVRSLAYDFQRRTGMECRFWVQEGVHILSLDIDMQLQCYRIIQECLANIEKHSGAAMASILIRNGGRGDLLIRVSDNGKGFSVPDMDASGQLRTEGHFGLWNMYGRAASLNGTLDLDSRTGEGTTISLRIPLGNAD
ncbi:sensor histidine kinase [Treponema sp. OttesenSCG-928-L16]|nr:sensor histidine kinase [Treponema sp. OttesenSCG-928-L16]